MKNKYNFDYDCTHKGVNGDKIFRGVVVSTSLLGAMRKIKKLTELHGPLIQHDDCDGYSFSIWGSKILLYVKCPEYCKKVKFEITATTLEDKNSASDLFEQYSAIALLLSTNFSSFSQKDVEKASDFDIILKDKPKGTKFKITIEEIK